MSIAHAYDRIGSFAMPASTMTLDAFRAWVASDNYPETGKVAFYNGSLYFDMSPERIDLHTKIKGEIAFVVAGIVRERDLGDFYPDGVLVTNKAAGVSNEPDASFASGATLESGRLVPPEGKADRFIDLVGTPDWVCEILSDSSVEKDIMVLREAYFKAGIPEYWLIDARGEEIDFKLLIPGSEGYEESKPADDGWFRSPVFEREFHLSRDRDRVNRWRYTLAHR